MNEIEIHGSKFRVYETGTIERQFKSGIWKEVKNTANHNQGYNVILVQKQQYMRSRLMFLAFMNHDKNEKIVMHHKDLNRLNCSLSNLSIETYSSMSAYRDSNSS